MCMHIETVFCTCTISLGADRSLLDIKLWKSMAAGWQESYAHGIRDCGCGDLTSPSGHLCGDPSRIEFWTPRFCWGVMVWRQSMLTVSSFSTFRRCQACFIDCWTDLCCLMCIFHECCQFWSAHGKVPCASSAIDGVISIAALLSGKSERSRSFIYCSSCSELQATDDSAVCN